MLADWRFRELVSIPLRASVIQGLTRTGYCTVGEVAELTPEKLVPICGIDVDTAADELRTVQRYKHLSFIGEDGLAPCLRGIKTTKELLDAEMCDQGIPMVPSAIVSMCRSFDDMLGGGFSTGKLTELCGEPGVGKTQFCIQVCLTVQLPHWFGGLEGEAVFIDTEGNFVPRRAQQMAQSLVDHCRRHVTLNADDQILTEEIRSQYSPSVENLLSGIHYIRVTDHLQLLTTCQRLRQFCEQHPKIRLIVVDSIALPFRYDFEDIPQRNRLLASVAQHLFSVACAYNSAVVLTNQITTRIEARVNPGDDPSEATSTHSAAGRLVPALGESWGHICSVRVFLTRSSDTRRQCKLLKHPGRPFGSGDYQITSGGIRDFVE